MTDHRELSLWFDQIGGARPGPALSGDLPVDVAIVGGGYTGLWTAYYLLRRDPSLRVAVLEARVCGFGASGRNGGWASALYPVSAGTLAAEHGHAAAAAQWLAMRESVYEVQRVASAEGIAADIAVGGTVTLVRSPAQWERARAEVRESEEFGLDVTLLDAGAAQSRLAATDVLGGTYTPHCAAVQPARLARGLADVVRGMGAQVYESTPVAAIGPGVAHTAHGSVRAATVVRATEGYTARLRGHRRTLAPVYSLIVATEPLSDAVWDQIGLRERETFADFRNLIVYGQRTADGRMVFGGRGAPYHLGSRIRPSFDRDPRVFDRLRRTLVEMFPVLRDTAITHRWGGALGIARDWHASVGLDTASGLAWAGGYVGDGVTTTNLAGRTLADLITGTDSPLTALPWVGHRSRPWEPEPLRWLGINGGLGAVALADRAEGRSGRPSRIPAVMDRLMGR